VVACGGAARLRLGLCRLVAADDLGDVQPGLEQLLRLEARRGSKGEWGRGEVEQRCQMVERGDGGSTGGIG